eukprot:TRINITY_DN3973_c0_g1_i1.p1 TRINITY_DN3973_c0_g1~~TRINITY_DN3973_c0_g1_i1.p1  ORF type:complete len:301 (-),score=62.93 TRINITY_DN3973_c0_g1_i1:90-992(-)
MVDPNPRTRIKTAELLAHPLLSDRQFLMPLMNIAVENSPIATPSRKFRDLPLSKNTDSLRSDNQSFVCGKSPLINGRVLEIQESPFNSPLLRERSLLERPRADVGTRENPSPFARAYFKKEQDDEETKEGSFSSQLANLQNMAKGKRPSASNQSEMAKRAMMQSYYKKAENKTKIEDEAIPKSPKVDGPTESELADLDEEESCKDTPQHKIKMMTSPVMSKPPSKIGRNELNTPAITASGTPLFRENQSPHESATQINHGNQIEISQLSKGTADGQGRPNGNGTKPTISNVKNNLKRLID